ncbi:hypothetical protein HD554DRAFT_2165620 [Boletus coccyginus]|nr:hypothetical protein HD554DRAFT_2165620 [Boletus coccyginus]
MSHIHYRLALNLMEKSLSSFASSKELVQALHDAMIAHQQAYAIGILHHDLSVGNIIIIDERGYLIDWDFAKSMSVE